MSRIESLLSARLFLVPQLAKNRIYFISNLSGHLSLYAMDYGGSVPEPLLPPHIALQNPALMNGRSFVVFPDLDEVLVMIDQDGDENYRPMVIPSSGGFPLPAFGDRFDDFRTHCFGGDLQANLAYLWAESRQESLSTAFRANLATQELVNLGESQFGCFPDGASADHSKVILSDAYGVGDHVLYLRQGSTERQLLYGVPIAERQPDQQVTPNSIGDCQFVDNDQAILFVTSLYSDTYGLGTMRLADPESVTPVKVTGTVHEGAGELAGLEHLESERYLLTYNIDGCSWLYEGVYDPGQLTMSLDRVLCGQGPLSGGVEKGFSYDRSSDRFVLSFTTATSPTQIYTIEGRGRDRLTRHTRERVLGVPEEVLSAGEDYSFDSYDGLRISARLYLPAESLGFEGPRPVVYYIHGGPQSQEHPDFAWFSMPLIQFLTLSGFAVFVPNVRGSTGYGFDYMNHVARDWGGADRLDHVHAMTEVLPADERLDTTRTAVVGRSYGGYMTLTLAARHAELWAAAVDMFGPYDLPLFMERLPETWKPYMTFLIGDPESELDFLLERSPRTYIHDVNCPLLVIQGKNDPRVIEQESRELVEEMRGRGKAVEYLMFEDEGHDILKFENRVRCYNAINDFFKQHLQP